MKYPTIEIISGIVDILQQVSSNMSSTLAPLYLLLHKGQSWSWGKEQQLAFDQSKTNLSASSFLIHFDPKLPLILACDASAYGIGAVLAHRTPEGGERPIGYVSQTLNSAERNYSQLEKEGLACIFGIKKFHSYLLGHPFELITDHRPLLALFKETGPIPAQASARIRRWSMFLSSYEYKISFRQSTAHGNADALSRLPLPDTEPHEDEPPELVLLVDHLNLSPITAKDIANWSKNNPQLFRVVQYIRQGWPTSVDWIL